MNSSVAVIGAGILGRLCAFGLAREGVGVTLIDEGTLDSSAGCSQVAAGMLAPYCELESAEVRIAELGLASIDLWPTLLAELDSPVFFSQAGSLVIAHPRDAGELSLLERRVKPIAPAALRRVGATEIQTLEPELGSRFSEGLFFPSEAQIDNRQVMHALGEWCNRRGLCQFETQVTELAPHKVVTPSGSRNFDWVVDCRGLGAQMKGLRPVRGEILTLFAPQVNLKRPIRLMHPRYPLYLVPRQDHKYLVGATIIESSDSGPVTVRSLLELLSAAFTVHPGFAEARLIESRTGLRPAFADHMPQICVQEGLMAASGLYRHGFLIAPQIARHIVQKILGRPLSGEAWIYSKEAA